MAAGRHTKPSYDGPALDPRRLLSEVDRETIRTDLLTARAVHAAAGAAGAPTLVLVDAALRRLDTAEYGYCAACGVRIATTVLLDVPHVEHCLLCAA